MSALLVWLRASERICVIVFAKLFLLPIGREIFARSRIDIMRIRIGQRRAKCDRGKIRSLAFVTRTGDELYDLCAHVNSNNAMAIRPASASDIK